MSLFNIMEDNSGNQKELENTFNLIEGNFSLGDKTSNFFNESSNQYKLNLKNKFSSENIQVLLKSIENLKQNTTIYLQKVMETNDKLGAAPVKEKVESDDEA